MTKKWEGKGYDINNNIIYELKNGKGLIIEFEDNELVFKGEYLNGKRNGKGKEYSLLGILRFDCHYLKGEKFKGKTYFKNKLVFEGEYLYSCMRKGKYYKNGKLEFEGEFRCNKKWNGKGYDSDGNVIYELINGNGKVKEYNWIGRILLFDGEYINGKRNGKVKVYYNSGGLKYEGEYLNDKKNGIGKEYYKNGQIMFEGKYLNDYKIKGKYYVNKQLEFEGEFKNNKKWNGIGYDENGKIIYKLINGNGKIKEYYANNNLEYEGEYLNGKRNGKGKEYSEKGYIKFEGEYLNGQMWNGQAYGIVYEGKSRFVGEFLNGKRNGKGEEHDFKGNLLFEGEYLNDRRWNGKGCEYGLRNKLIEYLNGKKKKRS